MTVVGGGIITVVGGEIITVVGGSFIMVVMEVFEKLVIKETRFFSETPNTMACYQRHR